MVTQSELLVLFTYDPDTGFLRYREKRGRMSRGDVAGTIDQEGYRIVTIKGRGYPAHRLIWLMVHGELPRMLDHVNRDRDDNRISNLRLCNEIQNAANAKAPCTNTSGYRGVYYEPERGLWRARIRYVENGVRKRLAIGRYTTAEEAAIHYNLHLKSMHADFALLNKVDTPLGRILGMSET